MTGPERAAICSALDFLARAQLESGQFPVNFTQLDELGSTKAPVLHQERSLFCATYVANSLSYCADNSARAMIARTMAFLAGEKTRGGLWRYWCRGAHLNRQVPPDTDDTACVSEVLDRLGGGSPDNEALLLANRSASGLFYTWFVPRLSPMTTARWWRLVLADITWGRMVTFWRAGARRGDIDPVVNANVLLYLGERAETAPVVDWLLEVAASGTEDCDKWYRSTPAFYYAVSRCYAADIAALKSAIPAASERLDGFTHRGGQSGTNPLQAALAACALMNFGAALRREDTLEYLLESQESDGGWGWFPFYFDGRPVPRMGWGSRALTTALCIEALVRLAGPDKLSRAA